MATNICTLNFFFFFKEVELEMPKQILAKVPYLGKGEGSAQWVLVIAKAFGL